MGDGLDLVDVFGYEDIGMDLHVIRRSPLIARSLQEVSAADDVMVWFRSAPEAVRGDREILLAAVAKDGYSLWHASDELKADREIVLTAMSQNLQSLRYAAADLRSD